MGNDIGKGIIDGLEDALVHANGDKSKADIRVPGARVKYSLDELLEKKADIAEAREALEKADEAEDWDKVKNEIDWGKPVGKEVW